MALQLSHALFSGYMDRLTPEQVPSLHGQNSLKAIHSLGEDKSTSATTLHPGWIAAIVVGSVAIICTILVVIILYVTFSNQYAPAPQRDQDGAEQGTTRQPVEETVQGSTDSPHFAISKWVYWKKDGRERKKEGNKKETKESNNL